MRKQAGKGAGESPIVDPDLPCTRTLQAGDSSTERSQNGIDFAFQEIELVLIEC